MSTRRKALRALRCRPLSLTHVRGEVQERGVEMEETEKAPERSRMRSRAPPPMKGYQTTLEGSQSPPGPHLAPGGWRRRSGY